MFGHHLRIEVAFASVGRWVSSPGVLPDVLVSVVVIILVTLGAVGIQFVKVVSDPELLFVPASVRGLADRAEVERLFPLDYDRYFYGHQTRADLPEVQVILRRKASTVLSKEFFEEAERVSILVESPGFADAAFSFGDCCARSNGNDCAETFRPLTSLKESFRRGINLTWPVMENPLTGETYHFPKFLGGVKLVEGSENIIESAEALRMTFPLDPKCVSNVEVMHAWTLEVVEKLRDYNSFLVEVHAVAARSITVELGTNVWSSLDLVPLSGLIVVAFTASVMSRSLTAVLALSGLLIAVVAVAGSWGALAVAGAPFQAINMAAVFLLLGISLDDTFVMVSAWERFRNSDSDEDRMVAIFEDAAVSITVTSVTNVVTFGVGFALAGFHSVEIFCLYTGVAVAAVYLVTLLVFGRVLAWGASLDRYLKERHPGLAAMRMPLARVGKWFNGHMGHRLVSFLNHKAGATMVMVLFVTYLGACMYLASNVKEGFERQRMARDHSPVLKFYELEDKYFRSNPYRLQIVLPHPLAYWDPGVQANISALLSELQETLFVSSDPVFEENWLKNYFEFLDDGYSGNTSPALVTQRDFIDDLNIFMEDVGEGTPVGQNVVFASAPTLEDPTPVTMTRHSDSCLTKKVSQS